MTFEDVFKDIKKGKRAFRKGFIKEKLVWMCSDDKFLSPFLVACGTGLNPFCWIPSYEDLFANDWEVAE
jgi:Protein of unknown function (DUF2829)